MPDNLINPERYYSLRGYNLNKRETLVKCPFHDDKVSSMSINKDTGLWRCFGCSTGGNITQFEAKLNNISTKDAYANLCKEFNIETSFSHYKTDKEIDIQKWHEALISNKKILDTFEVNRGIKIDIIKKYRLGFDGDRLTIPIYINGICVNVRKYKRGDNSKYIGIYGHNTPTLFPFDNLNDNPICLMEGELDCLLALQLGLNAITVTGGAGSWDKTWDMYFKDKDLVICYDIDKAGKDGAEKIYNILKTICKSIKNIELPIKDPPNGDFTDYIITHQFTINDFIELVKGTPVMQNREKEQESMTVSLQECDNAIYGGKYLEIPVTIAGKNPENYLVPYIFKVSCVPANNNKCRACHMNAIREVTIKIDKTSKHVLSLINTSDTQLVGALRKVANIICDRTIITILENQSVEELVAIPEITYEINDSEYMAKRIFFTGHGTRDNKSYMVKGYVYPDPKNQLATVLSNKMIATQGNLDPSLITNEVKEGLKIFQCKDDKDSITAKLGDIYDDLAYNVTKVYDRQDLHMAIDLCYHSVLSFDFCNGYVHKGWIDALIIGDTKTGKSKSTEAIIKHYRAGEIIGGSSISFAGLVGAAVQVGSKWSAAWGKMVLNNGRIIIIDEFKDMDKEEISMLTGIRTTGIAELTKVVKARTVAKTRFLCLSNPASDRKMNTYSNGILAIKELIGAPEDISRFDFALTVADYEVDQMKINSYYMGETKPHKYTSDLCHNMVLWTWTRNRDNIIFTENAEKAILELSLLLNEEYDSSIPLIAPAEQRIKLARMSIALAARLFSTDDTMEKIVVKEPHVEVIFDYLRQAYNKPSMGYDLYSNSKMKAEKYIKTHYNEIMEEFKSFGSVSDPNEWKRLRDLLLEYEIIRKTEIELYMKWDIESIKSFFKFVSQHRLMFSIHSGYCKHQLFIKMLKEMGADDDIQVTKASDTSEETILPDIVNKAKDVFNTDSGDTNDHNE